MVRIIDTRSKSFIMGWQAHSLELRAVRFCNDETTVFTLSADKMLMRWNAHDLGHPVAQSPPTTPATVAEDDMLLDFALDVENEFALRAGVRSAGDGGGECFIHSLRHQESDSHAPPVLTLTGHSDAVTCLDWCSYTNTCFTGSSDNTVLVYTLFKVMDG
jgi:WD40 repeat protein